MTPLDQTLVGTYHIDQLRADARRAAQARLVAPRTHLRDLRWPARASR
jgi:hypothetical protein